MDFPLEEFFAAIAAVHECMIEEEFLPEDGILDKFQFQHLVLDALNTMCECGECDDKAVDEGVVAWKLAMVSLFGNLDDVDVTIHGDGTTNIYEAVHKNGITATVQCPRSEIMTPEDQETHMIKAMEKLHTMLQE